jgi:DNA repair protein RadA/Sms
MSKTENIFECSKCGAQALKWAGRCGECGGWGTLGESSKTKTVNTKSVVKYKAGQVVSFDQVSNQNIQRQKTKIEEFDRVLGGGIVPGSIILLGGEPGIGKSTLILQVVEKISVNYDAKVLYVSGEESAQQIKLRLDRLSLKPEKINYLGETSVETINATIYELKPSLVIIDSIQTISSTDIDSEAGSVSQIRACTIKLLELAKKTGIPVIIIGHITKDGIVAGPKTLEHLVDTVLYLEGDRYHHFRLLRTIKNRFGATSEVGIFEMENKGLVEVKNPSAIFLDQHSKNISGSVITVLMEGTRPFFIEVQALVNSTAFGLPQRRASGFDLNRLQLLISVLTKRSGLKLFNQDVIINIAGGFKVQEPAVDLAVCLAIASALENKAVSNKTIVLGEVGLSGEIRNISNIEARLKEAEKLGFDSAIVSEKVKERGVGFKLFKVQNIGEALKLL